MSEIEWVDDVPVRPYKSTARYLVFADELKANPGRWAIFPYEGKAQAYAVGHNIRRGKLKAFARGQFQVSTRGEVIYIRFVGDA